MGKMNAITNWRRWRLKRRYGVGKKLDGPKWMLRLVAATMILFGVCYLMLASACMTYAPPQYYEWEVQHNFGPWQDMKTSEECKMNFLEMMKRGEWRLTKREF